MEWIADRVAYKGNDQFIRAFKGSELIWEKEKWEGLTIVSLEDDNVFTIKGTQHNNLEAQVYYSTDKGRHWHYTNFVYPYQNTVDITLNTNDELWLKYNGGYFVLAHINVTSTKNFNVKGNVMSLLYEDYKDKTSMIPDRGVPGLFSGATHLIDASELILPATTIYNSAYSSLFDNCSSMIKAPLELPAKSVPTADEHYLDGAYYSMFYGCPIEESPIIRAETIGWYESAALMFAGCSNLKKVVSYIRRIDTAGHLPLASNYALRKWMNRVSPTGIFYNLGGMAFKRDVDGIPEGWEIRTSL